MRDGAVAWRAPDRAEARRLGGGVRALPPADIPGVKTSVAKADRGRHAGGHAFVIECDSAVRDRYWPTPGAGGASEEWTRVANRALSSPEQRRLQETWDALAVGPPSANYTDGVVIAE